MCLSGLSDTSCGFGGAACEDCTVGANVCMTGVCGTPQATDGGTCTTKFDHDDGLNSILSTFQDCVPSTTVSSALAEDECNHNSSQCSQDCPGVDGGGPMAWCGQGFFGCDCWAFAGPAMGHVGQGGTNCVCPKPSDPTFH
jgi:hypothetical protein